MKNAQHDISEFVLALVGNHLKSANYSGKENTMQKTFQSGVPKEVKYIVPLSTIASYRAWSQVKLLSF